MDKKSIIIGSYNYIYASCVDRSQEEQFVTLVKLCNGYPEFHTDEMKGEMALSKEDAITLALYVAEGVIYSEKHEVPNDKTLISAMAMQLLSKYYPHYFVQSRIPETISEEPQIPESEENPAPPAGIDPDSIIQLEEVKESTSVNMDGIPRFKPISIPLDEEQSVPAVDPSNPALAYFRGQPIAPPPPPGLHRVDNPVKKSPVPPPSVDPVETDLSKVNFNGFMKPPVQAQKPEYIQSIPHPETAPEQNQQVGNTVNNSEIIRKYPKLYLGHIERLANANDCSVFFEEYPVEGIISVTVLDSQDKVMPWKSFCIDSGRIIDHRVKLIGGNPKFDMTRIIEKMPFYELFTGSHKGKILDTRMLEDIFQAGLENITKKKMYRKEFQDLNLKLALITLPTSFLNSEARKSLEDYLMKMDRDGYFDKAISMSPGSRFVFNTKRLDTKHLSRFTLINEGVPMYYGGPVPENLVPIIIESNDGKIDIRTNGNGDPSAIPAIKYEQ